MLTKLSFLAKLAYVEEKAASGINPARTEPFTEQAGGTLDVSTYDFVHAGRASLSAAGGGSVTASIDLWAAWTSFTANTKTNPTKLLGILFVTSGTPATAQVKVEPGASNPAPVPMGGTPSGTDTVTPKYTMDGNEWWGAGFAVDRTISATAKSLLLTSLGSTAIVVDYFFVMGGGSNS